MQRRRLGDSALNVSEICLGTMTFGEQNSEVEGRAKPMLAEQIAVRFPAIVDERTQDAGENPLRIEGVLSRLRVTGGPSEHRRGQRVHPVEFAGNVHPGFVGVD